MQEIERRFLVDPQNVPWSTALGAMNIRQGYLTQTAPVVRIRVQDEAAYITVKAGRGMVREEYEYRIPKSDAEEMLGMAVGHIIHKTRHRLPNLALVDEFHDHLGGLYIAEFEFASERDARRFVPPGYTAREVTEDDRYTNIALALLGLPDRL